MASRYSEAGSYESRDILYPAVAALKADALDDDVSAPHTPLPVVSVLCFVCSSDVLERNSHTHTQTSLAHLTFVKFQVPTVECASYGIDFEPAPFSNPVNFADHKAFDTDFGDEMEALAEIEVSLNEEDTVAVAHCGATIAPERLH